MKNILFLFSLLALVFTAQAQSGSTFYARGQDINDTLGVNSTFTYDINTLHFNGQEMSKTWEYSFIIEADSLSGSASDSNTVVLQVSNSSINDSNPLWTTIETGNIDGTATQIFRYVGTLYEPRVRLVISSKDTAKAIALRSYWTLKRQS